MRLFNVEETLEQVVVGMQDEVIWKIVSKLGGAIAKQFQNHTRAVAIASVASVPLYVGFRYVHTILDHIRSEREWEKKCNLSLVSAQLWVPVTAEELPAPQDFHVPLKTPHPSTRRSVCFSRTGTPGGHTGRLSDEHPGSSTPCEIRRGPSNLSLGFFCDFSGAEESGGHSMRHSDEHLGSSAPSETRARPGNLSVGFSCDASGTEEEGEEEEDSAESVSGVVKRTLWQKDIWKIGVLRDKRMHRAVITAAEQTTPEKPFVTEFLQNSDIWYVMNAIVNELSMMCGVQHLAAMQNHDMFNDADAYVIALMVPRLGADVKREFMGEEFCDTSTCVTKLRVIVVKERDLAKIATQQLVLQDDVNFRFKRRWDVISMMADKYRRFEACRILRHAITRVEEGDLAGTSTGQVSRSRRRERTAESAPSPSVSEGQVPRDDSFTRRVTASLPGLRRRFSDSRLPSKSELQRSREISREQFLQAGEDLKLPRRVADKLFRLLDVNGDSMLSVNEVDQDNMKRSHGRYSRQNYVSMHLQRAFLPRGTDQVEWPI
jgi:hypothetical protein